MNTTVASSRNSISNGGVTVTNSSQLNLGRMYLVSSQVPVPMETPIIRNATGNGPKTKRLRFFQGRPQAKTNATQATRSGAISHSTCCIQGDGIGRSPQK